MKKDIEQLLKDIKKMNRDGMEFKLQIKIIIHALEKLLKKGGE